MNFDDDFNNSEFADAMENIKSALFDITSTINVKLNELSNDDSEDAASFREELNARLMNIIRTSNEMLSNISAVDKYIDLDELVGEEEEDEVDLPTKEMDHIEVDEEDDVDDNTDEVENVDDEPTEDTEEEVEEKPKEDTPKSDLASKLNSIMASAGLDSDTSQSAVNSGNNNQEDKASVENEDNSSDENTAVEEESTTEEVEDTPQGEEEASLEENSDQVVVPSVEAPEENNEAVQEEETTSSDENNNQVVRPNVEEQEKNNEADKVSFVVNKDNKDLPKAILVTDKQYNKLLESLLSQKALCKFRNLLTTTSEIADDVNLEELMNQANDLYKNGDIKGAEEIYNKISEINASKNEAN